MNKQILFSVIIPTYNCAEYLKRALSSVFSQTYQNFEIIVIDNSSIDETKNVLKSFDNQKLKYIEVNNNGIIAHSRNKGIEKAKGDWIAFLDSDDYWEPEKLDKVKDGIEEKPEAILFCHDEWYVNNGVRKGRLRYGPNDKNLYEKLLFKGNCLSTSAVCLRSDIANQTSGFSERRDFISTEDYEYWIRLSQLGDVIFIDEILGEWCVHDSNDSVTNPQKHANAIIAVLEYHFGLWLNKFPNSINKIKYARGRTNVYAGRILQKGSLFSKASKFALKAIQINPFQWKAWGVLLLSLLRISSK